MHLRYMLSGCAIFEANAYPTAVFRDELNAGGLERHSYQFQVRVGDGRLPIIGLGATYCHDA